MMGLGVAAEAPPAVTFTVAVQREALGFGEPQTLFVTLSNQSPAVVQFRPGDLSLVQKGWESTGTGGTTRGLTLPLETEPEREAIRLPPAGSVTLAGVETELVCFHLGPMTASYELQAASAPLRELLPQRCSFKVRFEIGPSAAIRAVRSAQTDPERLRALASVRELLLLRTRWGLEDYLRGAVFANKSFTAMAGTVLPYLEMAAKDTNSVIRAQAVATYAAQTASTRDTNAAVTLVALAFGALKDAAPEVRSAGLGVLAYHWPMVPKALLQTVNVSSGAELLLAALKDPSDSVRAAALGAVLRSPHRLPLDRLKATFHTATGEIALGLQGLIAAQGDAAFSTTLLTGFAGRTQPERLAILTDMTGVRDSAALSLAGLGLRDTNAAVQHTALMRLLAFPPHVALPVIEAHAAQLTAEMRVAADAVRAELANRWLFPFLRSTTNQAAPQTLFPSQNGTSPMVSPDRQRIAYVEAGYGRPGGTGGLGGSNFRSLVHVVNRDGTGDQIVSDKYLVSWLADSRHIASSRNGHALITDLKGDVVAEFGTLLPESVRAQSRRLDSPFSRGPVPDHWTKGELRHQFGVTMPHRKHLQGFASGDAGGVFSPDGKWFGPQLSRPAAHFIGPDGEHRKIDWPKEMLAQQERQFSADFQNNLSGWGQRMAWSPDGRYVAVVAFWGKPWFILDLRKDTAWSFSEADKFPRYRGWDSPIFRWNPWSSDGSQLAQTRAGQVWISAPDGGQARQLTFDSLHKCKPTISPNGKRVAFLAVSRAADSNVELTGPDQLWVVDIQTTMTSRTTTPSHHQINCLDWLDDETLIFDRSDPAKFFNQGASLWRLSLKD